MIVNPPKTFLNQDRRTERKDRRSSLDVIPAQAGIQGPCRNHWIPACAGMTKVVVVIFTIDFFASFAPLRSLRPFQRMS
jgi:hypothetical protein